LAAIVFTDVAGFSSRVCSNESQALTCVHRDFQLMAPIIARHHGHLLKTMGDGQLISFSSATNAVGCALEMQQALAESARRLPPEEVLLHRVGIHLGDVFVSEKDVHGNGVNIAARLQGQAEPGGICISQTVYEVVRHQLPCKVMYLGAQELKNISDAVHVYRLLANEAKINVPLTIASPAERKVSDPIATQRAGISLSFDSKPAPAPVRSVKSQSVLSLLFVGDFTGRVGRPQSDRNRSPVSVDIDNFEQVLRSVKLEVPVLESAGAAMTIGFSSLDEFHPDHLLKSIPALSRLMELRRLLRDPAKAAQAEAEVSALVGFAPNNVAATSESDDEVLSRLLGKPRQETKPPVSGTIDISALVKSIAGPAAPACQERHKELLVRLEDHIARQLNGILHHPAFQSIEATWRGLDLLVREFGGEEEIRLSIFDISKAELNAHLVAGTLGEFSEVLIKHPASVIFANYSFTDSEEDLSLLKALAQIAEKKRVPLIAAADPLFVGCESFSKEPDPEHWKQTYATRDGWKAFRQTSEAAWVSLALPRFIIRQPYGKKSDAIESFHFEELATEPAHSFYLWANPVFACGHVIAEMFREDGWEGLNSGAISGELGSLPCHKFTSQGEVHVKPCSEAWLSERACNELIQQGFSPLQSIKGSSAVRVVTVQSASAATPRLRFLD
jgi:type VI secretion system protein ImpC